MRKEALAFVTLSMVGAATLVANSPAVVSSPPSTNTAILIADDATVYTVSMTATDADGYGDIRNMRILFNAIDYNFNAAQSRGYLSWGVADTDITRFNEGGWVLADATGGGRWAYLSTNWGGTTYCTPIGCSTTTAGAAAGATGSRTATWSFRAKPAWAQNPLTNDADAFIMDNTTSSGWQESPNDFDVVAACSTQTPAPRAPVVSPLTSPLLAISIDPADPATDQFAIRVTGGGISRYVQADGQVGLLAVYQTKSQWGATTVTGLSSSTTYAFAAKAFRNTPGYCPSAFGPAAMLDIGILERSINLSAAGRPLSPLVAGNAARLNAYQVPLDAWEKIWETVDGTMARGVLGGLDAETYNWKDMGGQGVDYTGTPGPDAVTTLGWMRRARDHGSTPLLTVNLRGIGPQASSGYGTFYYTDTSIATVTQLAADWVRYVNFILPTYRQGATLTTSDQAILDGINWFGQDKLLAQGEASTPHVTYWEIGNEPEIPQPWETPNVPRYSPTPAEYVDRYKQITAAMLAIDPSIKVGPCITNAGSGGVNAWLSAVLSDPVAKVDFISYHPYGPLREYASTYGDSEATAESGLQYIRQQQINLRAGIRTVASASGRNSDLIPLIASEWNSSDWVWEATSQIRRVSQGLGVIETVWTFADLGFLGATYWSYPAWLWDGTETPCFKAFEGFAQHLGTTLIDTFTDDAGVHVYTSRKTNGEVAVWALNFSPDLDKPFRMKFTGRVVQGLSVLQLANVNGETHLFDTNEPPATADPVIDWVARPSPVQDENGYLITLPHSTATVITIQHRASAEGDFDADGDVDQVDFGHLQTCLTGAFIPQTDPACADAMLTNDSYVDNDDVTLFLLCMQGPGAIILPGCSQ